MILLNAVQTAQSSNAYYSSEMRDGLISLFAIGLTSGEEIVVQISIDGVTWEDLYQYGVKITLTSTNNAVGVYAPAFLRVNLESSTVNPVTVSLNTVTHAG